MERKPKRSETLAEKMARHLAKARAEGIQLLLESESEEHFATSGTMPGIVYRVSNAGCSCQGFRSFGYCKHYALFMDRHAFANNPIQLAERRAQRVAAMAPQHARAVESPSCPDCYGAGFRKMSTGGRLSDWWAAPCHACQGTGTVATPPAPQAFAAD